jgi:hypothetical protein
MEICSTAANPKDAFRILDSRWDGKTAFKVRELAEVLGISPCSAWAAVNTGKIASVRIGRRIIIPRHVVERLLAA